MKFKIDRQQLIKSLSLIQGVVDKKSTLPILSHALFEMSPNQLKILATDLEIGIETELKIQADIDCQFVLPAKQLLEMCKQLQGDELSFKVHESKPIEISSKQSLYKLMQMSPEEFPAMPSYDSAVLQKIEADDLSYMIDKTLYGVCTDESRYNLNGVLAERVEDQLRLVATDGHRLACIEKPIPLDLTESHIVPRKAIVEIKKHLLDDDENYFFGIDGKSVILKKDTTTLIARLIEGQFPDYKRVIPKNQSRLVVVNREELLGALRRVSVLSLDKNRGVKMIFSSGLLEIESSHPDLGEAREELSIDYHGEHFSVGFNPRYFLDALQSISDEKMILELNDEVSPAVIRSEFDKSLINVIMPMRI